MCSTDSCWKRKPQGVSQREHWPQQWWVNDKGKQTIPCLHMRKEGQTKTRALLCLSQKELWLLCLLLCDKLHDFVVYKFVTWVQLERRWGTGFFQGGGGLQIRWEPHPKRPDSCLSCAFQNASTSFSAQPPTPSPNSLLYILFHMSWIHWVIYTSGNSYSQTPPSFVVDEREEVAIPVGHCVNQGW